MVSKIKFYMDYFVSKLSLIYFSTFSGNRFNSDYIEIAILELVVEGHFKNQLSQEMPFGTLEEMPHSFSFLNQRPHTSASLLHSHLDPCGSAVSVKTKQTASPQRPRLQCSVVLPCLSLRGGDRGTGRSDVLEHRVAASWRLAPHAELHFSWSRRHGLACGLTVIPAHPPKPIQNPHAAGRRSRRGQVSRDG